MKQRQLSQQKSQKTVLRMFRPNAPFFDISNLTFVNFMYFRSKTHKNIPKLYKVHAELSGNTMEFRVKFYQNPWKNYQAQLSKIMLYFIWRIYSVNLYAHNHVQLCFVQRCKLLRKQCEIYRFQKFTDIFLTIYFLAVDYFLDRKFQILPDNKQ